MLTGSHIELALKTVGAGGGLVMPASDIASAFNDAIMKYGEGLFVTTDSVASMLSSAMMESAYFRTTEEYNTTEGEYQPFRGRTFIQITWKSNYLAFGKWCKSKGLVSTETYFVDNPSRLADLKWAAIGPVWYFTKVMFSGKPLTAYSNNIEQVSKAVNLGNPFATRLPNGYLVRSTAYAAIRNLGSVIVPKLPQKEEGTMGIPFIVPNVDNSVLELQKDLAYFFPELTHFYGYAGTPDHNTKRCLDAMVYDSSNKYVGQQGRKNLPYSDRIELGDRVCAFVRKYAEHYHVNGIIWNRKVWGFPHKGGVGGYHYAGPWGVARPYSITAHDDHNHIELDGRNVSRLRGSASATWNGKEFPGSAGFYIDAKGPWITLLGNRLEAHGWKGYKDGPGPRFTETDRDGVRWFQKKQGWTGDDADGYPGAETWKRLMATPVAPTPKPETKPEEPVVIPPKPETKPEEPVVIPPKPETKPETAPATDVEKTYSKPTDRIVYDSKIKPGQNNSDSVWWVQKALNEVTLEGGSELKLTGTYDKATVAEVKKFQAQKCDDPADGDLGPKQTRYLFELAKINVTHKEQP